MSDCCASDGRTGDAHAACPSCATVGREVGRETVGAMAALDVPASHLSQRTYRYCATPGCSVVYYRDRLRIDRQGIRVPLNAKDDGLDVPLCYCFGHTRRSIATEVAAGGRSATSAVIAREIKAGHCACEVKNPSGRCCLGEVRAYERKCAAVANATLDPASNATPIRSPAE